MSTTTLVEVQAQIQQFWAPLFVKELRESLLLGALVNKDYDGDIKKRGDTVKVSQIIAPKGKLRTVGVDADSFSAEPLETKQIEIKADKRATAAFKFEDLVEVQSQIGDEKSEIRTSMMFAVDKQINDHLYSLVNPQSSPFLNDITGVTDLNATQMVNVRKLAGQNKWRKDKGWWLLADPSYHSDLLAAQTLTSSDFTGADPAPVVAGEIPNRRFGFNILEDNSRGVDFALAFHPDFLHLVTQLEANFEISSLHSQERFGFVMSVNILFGAKLGIDGQALHIRIKN